MAKVIIKMKQRFRMIRFSSFLSKTFRVALIFVFFYVPYNTHLQRNKEKSLKLNGNFRQ